MKTTLLIGSAPDAVRARPLQRQWFDEIVVLNNAWRIRPDWDFLVIPDDFPAERTPRPTDGQTLVRSDDYVPANNAYGGIIYAGATMTFTAAYWALSRLQPQLLVFLGCDMIYKRGARSHFYGNGTADPLRDDPTLQLLESKATRLMLLAARQGCLCANLGANADTRLTFPRITPAELAGDPPRARRDGLAALARIFDPERIDAALAAEASSDVFVKSGRYWETDMEPHRATLFDIDIAWRTVARAKAA